MCWTWGSLGDGQSMGEAASTPRVCPNNGLQLIRHRGVLAGVSGGNMQTAVARLRHE